MNKQELRGAFSKVQAPDGLFDTVCALEKEPKPRLNAWMIVRRVAAVAAVLAIVLTAMLWPAKEENYITAPGLLTVRAHATDSSGDATIESATLEEGVVFTPEYVYRTDTSYRPNYPFFFQIDHELFSPEEMVLEVSSNAGIFYKHSPGDLTMIGKSPMEQLLYYHYGQHFTVSADTALYWKPDGCDYEYLKEQFTKGSTDINQALKPFGFSENPSYFDVIIRANGYIIGYCVIEVTMSPTDISPYAHLLSFEVVSLVGFPMVDGEFQRVTKSYVTEKMAEAHSSK